MDIGLSGVFVCSSPSFKAAVSCEADSANVPDDWTLSRPCDGLLSVECFSGFLTISIKRMMRIYRESRAVWAF